MTKAFGIEISDASIKVMQLTKNGQFFKLQGYNIVKIPAGLVVAGEIKDQPTIANYIQQALQNSKPSRISTNNVVCSLPENKTFVRILNLPQMTPEEMAEGIKWQAEQYIPLPIDTVYLDWQIIKAINNKQRILIAAAPKKFIDTYVNVLKLARLRPLVFDLEEAAEARAIIKEPSTQASLIVDIGATKTVFIVHDKNIVPFAANTQEISGQKFTKNIAQALNIKIEDAENKKIACCSANLTTEEKAILQSLNSSFNALANEINKIINYYQNHFASANPIQNIFICGGASSIDSLIPHLALILKKKIINANPMVNITQSSQQQFKSQDLTSLTTVIGLSIRGADLEKYSKKLSSK